MNNSAEENLTEVGYLVFNSDGEGSFYPICENRTFAQIHKFWEISGFNCLQVFAKEDEDLTALIKALKKQ